MPTITISGIPGADGSYEFDAGYFTNRELHTIKEISGVRAGELGDAFLAGDNDVVVAVALIALKRAGKDIPVDLLWDAVSGKIVFEADAEVEDDDLPPASPPQSETPSGGDDATRGSGSSLASGLGSGNDSGLSLDDLSPTGAPV